MTDPRVTELDYDAIRESIRKFSENAEPSDWRAAYLFDVPALLDRIEVLERNVESLLEFEEANRHLQLDDLDDEFGHWGCDTLSMVCEALREARAKLGDLA